MEKFILHGKCKDGCLKQLKIPSKKIFDLKNQTVTSILQGQNRDITYDQDVFESLFPHRPPVKMRTEVLSFATPDEMFRSHRVVNYNILDHIYSKHDYPLAQGPAVPPIDKEQFGSMNKSLQQVFGERTEYSHSADQECYEWIPTRIGIEAWIAAAGHTGADYEVRNSQSIIVGAASMRSMSVVYTCTHNRCIIHCPCNCCRDTRQSCKNICKNFPCEDCSSQCKEHTLKVSRLFDPATDHYTMVTDMINSAR